jgi:hypothetical protein
MQKEHLPAVPWCLGNNDHDSGSFPTFYSPYTSSSKCLYAMYSNAFVSALITIIYNMVRQQATHSGILPTFYCNRTGVSQTSYLNEQYNTIFRAFPTPRKHPASQKPSVWVSPSSRILGFHVVPEPSLTSTADKHC